MTTTSEYHLAHAENFNNTVVVLLENTPLRQSGMPAHIRNQTDDLGDVVSQATATHPIGESLTRQEFKDDADINRLLARFGVNTQVRNDLQYGTQDDTLGLQELQLQLESAKNVMKAVPPELHDKYPNWLAVMSGIERGEYEKDLKDLAEKKRSEDFNRRKQEYRDTRQVEREVRAEDAAEAVRTGRDEIRAPEATPNR